MRACKNCEHFQWAGDSPAAKLRRDNYVRQLADYNERNKEKDAKGFWASLWDMLPGPYMMLPESPPYPVRDPQDYGWCRMEPKAIEMGVNDWCSHFVERTP